MGRFRALVSTLPLALLLTGNILHLVEAAFALNRRQSDPNQPFLTIFAFGDQHTSVFQ